MNGWHAQPSRKLWDEGNENHGRVDNEIEMMAEIFQVVTVAGTVYREISTRLHSFLLKCTACWHV